jgi:ATP-dependent metalloprotease
LYILFELIQDFSKLRAIHQQRSSSLLQQRMMMTTTTTTPLLQSSFSFTNNNNITATTRMLGISHQERRYFFTALNQARRDMEVRYWHAKAQSAPDDPYTQGEFLQRLANVDPQALIGFMSSSSSSGGGGSGGSSADGAVAMALTPDSVLLYLNTLRQSGQYHQLHVRDLMERLRRGGVVPSHVVDAWSQEMALQHKTSKADQTSQLAQLLSSVTGGGGASAFSAAAAGSFAARNASGSSVPSFNQMQMQQQSLLSSSSLGRSPYQPIHVQMARPTVAPWRAVAGFIGRVAIVFIGFAALGALIDSQGLGRGMGNLASSKHIQDANSDGSGSGKNGAGKKIKFDDVKGVDEAKADLEEIVLYLKDPDRFTRLGGKLPRGVLLTGPPGTGKTLLAKAIAGEADVPFFYASGSQFEEVYVGLGAKRIRELFEAAKKKKVAIIFIDEIDAVGGTRKLKDQSALKMTLNELLVQMDGFEANDGIIVIGATNFVESLDSALLRPGRFDKHVTVPLPDVGGRKAILEMYAARTRMSADVDLNVLARGTTGMSGADLYNLINQAAVKASVDGLSAITMQVLEYAKDKILMGAERKTAVISKETARNTAYHEAGHALVGVLTDGAMPIHKATIMPRGPSLGMVSMLPEGDQTSQSKRQMLAMMDVAMGGRVAEELVFGDAEVTSGASNDILQATRIARAMVTKYGFSPEVGIVYHGGESGQEASAETRALVDVEVKKLTHAAYTRARQLLVKHQSRHKLLAETLLEYETLTGDEVRNVVQNGIKPQRPVINKVGGERGDTSILDTSSASDGGDKKGIIPGL